jgi:hypothetical protein
MSALADDDAIKLYVFFANPYPLFMKVFRGKLNYAIRFIDKSY